MLTCREVSRLVSELLAWQLLLPIRLRLHALLARCRECRTLPCRVVAPWAAVHETGDVPNEILGCVELCLSPVVRLRFD